MSYSKIVRRFIYSCRQDGAVSTFEKLLPLVLEQILAYKKVRYTTRSVPLVYLYLSIRMRHYTNSSDADPMKTTMVKPSDIKYYFGKPPSIRFQQMTNTTQSSPEQKSPPRGYGQVENGNWDQNNELFDETIFYKSFEERYYKNYNWENTKIYQILQKDIEREIARYDCTTTKELDVHFENVDILYNNIKEKGYKTQFELLQTRDGWEDNTDTPDAIHPLLNEVGINIGRDGQMGKISSGDHRLAIAKILELDHIPVIVRARHKQWQNIRDEYRNQSSSTSINSPGRHFSHPDLQDIIIG